MTPSMQSLSRYPINPTRTTALLAGNVQPLDVLWFLLKPANVSSPLGRRAAAEKLTKPKSRPSFFQLYFPDMHTNWQDSSTARRLVGWCNCSGRQFLRLKIFGYNPIKNLATKMRAQNQMPWTLAPSPLPLCHWQDGVSPQLQCVSLRKFNRWWYAFVGLRRY